MTNPVGKPVKDPTIVTHVTDRDIADKAFDRNHLRPYQFHQLAELVSKTFQVCYP